MSNGTPFVGLVDKARADFQRSLAEKETIFEDILRLGSEVESLEERFIDLPLWVTQWTDKIKDTASAVMGKLETEIASLEAKWEILSAKAEDLIEDEDLPYETSVIEDEEEPPEGGE
ncbi:MAG: hypothetical protein ACXABY_01530 [Candidatus Thorarchaeota archaeon]|jgi:predicted nuclease with TOPRIM domain